MPPSQKELKNAEKKIGELKDWTIEGKALAGGV
jgi:hypothetical protein